MPTFSSIRTPSMSAGARVASRLHVGTALSGAAAALLLIAPNSASAAGECGPPSSGTVTCQPTGNPYPNGIAYATLAPNDLTVVVADEVVVNTTAPVRNGISVSGFGGADVTLDADNGSSISTTGLGSFGVFGLVNGGGDVTLNVSDVTTSGNAGIGVFGLANGGGNIVINASEIHTSGNPGSLGPNTLPATAILGFTGSDGDVTITASNVSTTGDGAGGIVGTSAGGGTVNITTTGTVVTEGVFANGVVANTPGNIVINAQSVQTTGDYSSGIVAESYLGDIAVVAGDVSTSGAESLGVEASTYYGNIDIDTTGLVSTSGYYAGGVIGASYYGSVDITVNDVNTTGDGSIGVAALTVSEDMDIPTLASLPLDGMATLALEPTEFDAKITVTGDVSTSGIFAPGAVALSGAGNAIVINNGAISTEGDFSPGIVAVGPVGASVTGSGSVSTLGAASFGILGASYGDVEVALTGSVTTAGESATGILATSAYGNISVSSSSSVSTSGAFSDGIRAETYLGDVDITSTGSVSTSGFYSDGILVESAGAVNVAVNDVTTSGDLSYGINITNTAGQYYYYGEGSISAAVAEEPGDVSVTLNGDLSTSGAVSNGIDIYAYSGAVSVSNLGSVSTTGAYSDGIVVDAGGDATLSGTGTVSTSGYAATGIDVHSYGDVSVTSGAVTTSGDYSTGVHAHSVSDGNTSTDIASITTTGFASEGLEAWSDFGNVDAKVGTVITSGADSTGVDAYAYFGSVTVNSGTVRVTGEGSDAIVADGFGDVTVNAGTTTAALGTAIDAYSYAGNVAVNVAANGRATSGNGNAIVAEGYTGAAVTVGSGAIVSGASNAIVITTPTAFVGEGGGEDAVTALLLNPADASSVVTNRGTITGGTGFAVLATGGSTLIDNLAGGTINGRVSLTTQDDLFRNAGTFNTTGTSDFGDGDDAFNNAATGVVRTTSSATLAGLETFTNAGTVTMVDNGVGDTLTLPGAYVGNGGSLAIDANFNGATPTGDRLIIGGAATGLTSVVVNQLASSPTVGTTLTIVDAGAGSSGGAFALSAGSTDLGFLHYGILFDAANNNYNLTSALGAPVFRTMKINEGAQSLWYKSADAWSAHMTALRDAAWGEGPAPLGRVWGQIYGAVDKRQDVFSYTASGLTQVIDLGYRQDYFGGQLGVDLGSSGDEGGAVFGITGGYLSSVLKTRRGGDRTTYDAFNIGAYAGFTSQSFFVNALAKYDFYNIKTRSIGAGYAASIDGKAYGAQAEAGFRFGSDSFYAEPVVSIAYVKTDLDDFTALGALVDFDKLTGLRGKAGLRIGGASPLGGGKLVYYAGAHVVKEFEGREGITFTSGASSFDLKNRRLGTYGQAQLGINIVSAGGVTGFIEGNANLSGDYKGYGGRAGIRFPF